MCDKMKILILGENEDDVENLVDMLNGLNQSLMGRVINGEGNDATVKGIQEGLNKGYDLVIVKIDNNIGTAMLLNKDKRINAAPCSTVYDIKLAKSNNANVILLSKNNELDKDAFKIFKLAQNSTSSTQQQNVSNERPIKVRQQIVTKEQPKNIEPVVNQNTEQKSKGFFKNIKESLGITEE